MVNDSAPHYKSEVEEKGDDKEGLPTGKAPLLGAGEII